MSQDKYYTGIKAAELYTKLLDNLLNNPLVSFEIKNNVLLPYKCNGTKIIPSIKEMTMFLEKIKAAEIISVSNGSLKDIIKIYEY